MNRISPIDFYEFLKARNINHLYFACSVNTACSLINNGELMSKRKLSFKKLSAKDVDFAEKEKIANLWNKIILHICDLHGYLTRQNKMGPVCFVLNIDFLLETHETDLLISKKNPIYRKKGEKKAELYYSSVAELNQDFDNIIANRTAQKNMILIRDKRTSVNLQKYLTEIIIDKPGERYLLFAKAKNALLTALNQSGLEAVPFRVRNCKNFCYCLTNYSEMSEKEINEFFNP